MPEIIPNWHPILVHFTFALLFLSPFFFAAALFGAQQDWGKTFLIAGRAFLWTGVLITVLTLWAGFGAMEQAHDHISQAADSHIHDHRNWAIATAVTFALLAIWSFTNWWRDAKEGLVFLILLFVAAGLLATTGYKGGELVFKHGVGVMPQQASGTESEERTNTESSNHSHTR